MVTVKLRPGPVSGAFLGACCQRTWRRSEVEGGIKLTAAVVFRC